MSHKLFSIYNMSLHILKFLLLEGGICVVQKYKAVPILHFCNLSLYIEHAAFGVLNAKGDSVQIQHCGTCW